MRRIKLTTWIGIAMALGIVVGYVCNKVYADQNDLKDVAGYFNILTDLFLRMIKMIIAPLVFSTLVVGVAKMEDIKAVGRIGLKTMVWFLGASLASLLLGMIMVNILRPGDALNLPLPEAGASSGLKVSSLSLKEFVTHLVPKSIIEAMATNEILQIVVFSAFFAAAAVVIGERSKAIIHLLDDLAHIMLKLTGYVMAFAPIAVFAAIASAVTTQGLGVLVTYGKFMGEFYFSLALLWLLLIAAGYVFLRSRVFDLVRKLRAPALLAFSTASSESAFPKMMEQLERFGVSEKITSFVLPIGYSFNLDGSMMYCTFATLFIAQAYGIDLSIGQQLTMLLVLMLTSKGMAAVPRASLVVIAATLNQFKIPEAGLLIIMGVDQFLDMGRTATNVIGNGIATAFVAKTEGELGEAVSDEVPIEAVLDAESAQPQPVMVMGAVRPSPVA